MNISKLFQPALIKLPVLLSVMFSAFAFADNPIVSHVYTADPAARVFNGRMYVITSHDLDTQASYDMHDYHMFSSDDMVNWQDHGVVFDVLRDTTWASKAYAPDIIERNGKYYLYFPNGASSIGVAVADQPGGPYTDALGGPLVNKSMPNAGVPWLFDPAVFIDEDGQAYLYFGGGSGGDGDFARVILLNEDMITTSGDAISIDVPNFFEGGYMHKRDGVYYFSYASTFGTGAKIDYMTSTHPTSGFAYRGAILPNPWQNNSNNNHASILEFNNQWYIFYHNRVVANERGASSYQRSINVDRLYYNDDGTIQEVNNGSTGVPKLKDVDPFVVNEAETIDREEGIETEACSEGGINVLIDDQSWIKVSNLDFGAGAQGFIARVASSDATSIDIILDDLANPPAGTLNVSGTGGLQMWETHGVTIAQTTGLHNLYLRANGRINLNWYQFTAEPDPTPEPNPGPSSSSSSSGSSSSSSSASSSSGGTGGGGSSGSLLLILLLFTLLHCKWNFSQKKYKFL